MGVCLHTVHCTETWWGRLPAWRTSARCGPLAYVSTPLRVLQEQHKLAASSMHEQIERVHRDFEEYQRLKAHEIAALDERVRALIQNGATPPVQDTSVDAVASRSRPASTSGRQSGRASAGRSVAQGKSVSKRASRPGSAAPLRHVSPPTPTIPALHGPPALGSQADRAASTLMSAAAASDAVQAAERDASFERLARQRVEAELAAANDQLRQTRTKVRGVQAQLREVEQEAGVARHAERHAEREGARLEASQREAAELQEQLRAAKAECSRRAALLRAAQVRTCLVPQSLDQVRQQDETYRALAAAGVRRRARAVLLTDASPCRSRKTALCVGASTCKQSGTRTPRRAASSRPRARTSSAGRRCSQRLRPNLTSCRAATAHQKAPYKRWSGRSSNSRTRRPRLRARSRASSRCALRGVPLVQHVRYR